MIKQITNLLSLAFALLWSFVIFAEFWRYNPEYAQAIEFFSYPDLFILLLVIGGLLTWGFSRIQKAKKNPKWINALTIFFGLLLIDILTMAFLYSKMDNITLTNKGLGSHLAHLVGVAAAVYLVYLTARSVGQILTNLFNLPISKSDLPLIQVALGIMIITSFLFFLGLMGLLKMPILAVLFLFFLGLDWRGTLYILRNSLLRPIASIKELNGIGVFCFLFVGVYLLYDFVQILRPFPAGTDAINLYVNLPNLIGDSGALIAGNQPYNWSLFMAIGKVLFGRIDVVLALSYLGGFLALQALYQLSLKWLSVNQSALVLLLFVTMPMTNFFLYQDMKIDMGLLFLTFSVLLLFYHWAVPPKQETPELIETEKKKKTAQKNTMTSKVGLPNWQRSFRSVLAEKLPVFLKNQRMMVVMGLLMGFAFGVKLTVLFVLFALGTAICASKGGVLGYFSALLLSLGAALLLQLDAHPLLRDFHESVSAVQWALLVAGLGLTGFWFSKNKTTLMETLAASAVLALFFVLPILPWLGKNMAESDSFSMYNILNGKKATPMLSIQGLKPANDYVLPGPIAMPKTPENESTPNDQQNPKPQKEVKSKVKDAVRVDLHRFMGFEILPARYLSLPYDTFQRTNLPFNMNSVSFVLLLLLPMLFLFWKKPGRWALPLNLLLMALLFLMLTISIPSAYMNKNGLTTLEAAHQHLKENPAKGFWGSWSDNFNEVTLRWYAPIFDWFTSVSDNSDAITYPILMGLFLLLAFMVHLRSKAQNNITRSFLFFLCTYFYLWWLLGAGGSWYGMILFCLPFVFLLKGIPFSNQKTWADWAKTGILGVVCLAWFFMAFTFRSANFNPKDKDWAKQIYIPPFVEYQANNFDAYRLTNLTFSGAADVEKILNRSDKLVYRIGTQMNYFIDHNDRRVFTDTFLDTFQKLAAKYQDKEKIMEALKAEGFEYIVFDINLSGNDRTPEKSLTRKFTNFINAVYANPKLELVFTDRIIETDGKKAPSIFPGRGKVINFGTMAVLKIK